MYFAQLWYYIFTAHRVLYALVTVKETKRETHLRAQVLQDSSNSSSCLLQPEKLLGT